MRQKHTGRHTVSPEALSILRREGIGWNHELDSSALRFEPMPKKAGIVARMAQRLGGRG